MNFDKESKSRKDLFFFVVGGVGGGGVGGLGGATNTIAAIFYIHKTDCHDLFYRTV